MTCADLAPPKSAARSRLGNGSLPAGVDGRSTEWRRFKELRAAFSEEFGATTASELSDLERAVWLTIRGEQLQAGLAAGQVIDDDAMIRNANAVSRALATLRNRRKSTAKQSGPDTLRSYLSSRAGQA